MDGLENNNGVTYQSSSGAYTVCKNTSCCLQTFKTGDVSFSFFLNLFIFPSNVSVEFIVHSNVLISLTRFEDRRDQSASY